MNPLKLAVVGVGALGRHHARILGGLESADLVAVAEMNLEVGRAVASACGCDHVTDFHELLDRVDAVTIAVPTSVGYGVAAKGMTALHAMLSSCANGITVVNIDNGYGAAVAAYRILQQFYLFGAN